MPAKIIKRFSMAAVFAIFALCGVRNFWTPAYEIAYTTGKLSSVCAEGVCSSAYILKLGNTGRQRQEQVNVAFAPMVKDAALPVAAYNFGKIRREMELEEDDSQLLAKVGALEPGKVVEIRFLLQRPAGKSLPEWDELLRDISPAQGQAIRGDPQTTTFFRFLFSVFTLWTR